MVLAQFKWLVKINERALDLWLGYAPVPSRSEPHERPAEADGMQSISWRMWDINYNDCIQTRHNKTWHVPNKDKTHTYLDIHKNTSSLHGDVLRTPEKSSRIPEIGLGGKKEKTLGCSVCLAATETGKCLRLFTEIKPCCCNTVDGQKKNFLGRLKPCK